MLSDATVENCSLYLTFFCTLAVSLEMFQLFMQNYFERWTVSCQYWLPLNTRPKKKHFFSGKLSHVGKNLCCCAYLSLWKLVLLAKHIPSFSRYNATHTLWKYVYLFNVCTNSKYERNADLCYLYTLKRGKDNRPMLFQ